MKAAEVLKITIDARANDKDTRLEKYIEWIERDCLATARNGKFEHIVNYSDRPLTDEFILKIQDSFISNGFTVIASENILNFRVFTISWKE